MSQKPGTMHFSLEIFNLHFWISLAKIVILPFYLLIPQIKECLYYPFGYLSITFLIQLLPIIFLIE
jgi:hypothetical protein